MNLLTFPGLINTSSDLYSPEVSLDNSDISVRDTLYTSCHSLLTFFTVKTISILISGHLTQSSPLLDQILICLNSNYAYNIIAPPTPCELCLFPFDLEHEGFVITASANQRFDRLLVRDNCTSFSAALWRRNGYYLVMLTDAQTEEQVVRWLREMWTTVGSVAVMTIFRGHVWAYQPFQQVNGSYGRIEIFTGTDLKGYNANYKRQVTRNLHGYPLRLELFESGYYVPQIVVVNGRKNRREPFVGPDKETIDVLEEKMNFTGN